MIRNVFGHIIRFSFLLILQGLVINRLDIADGMVYPFVYIFALLMLPFETPRLVMLLIGFVYGMAMDAFANTMGMHASACVAMTFAQGILLRVMSPREGYEFGLRPTIQYMGIGWYLPFALILSFIHHTWLFSIEVFRWSDFGTTFLKIILSTLATLLLMVVGQYLIFSQRKSVA